MKTAFKFFFGLVCVFGVVAQVNAEQSEQIITLSLSGFYQGQDSLHNDRAVSFRYTTKDLISEIGFFTGRDLSNGTLLLINSISDTNALSRFVVRTKTTEVDVTDLLVINQGNEVHTSKLAAGVFKSATLYSIDAFQFNTLDTDTNGLVLDLQLFARESQRATVKKVGGSLFDVVSSTLAFDGNGEINDQYGLLGPVKGTLKIGASKYVESPAPADAFESSNVSSTQGVVMESVHAHIQTLPSLPEN